MRQAVAPEDRSALKRLDMLMVPVTAALLVTGLGSVIARSTGHEETAWVLLAV